ncbi:MAG TPA: hypothetical protein VI072_18150 [Polyangiaceae bacterium]
MSDERDPERLLSKGVGTPERLREVLASAEADSPSPQDMKRLTAALASVLPPVSSVPAPKAAGTTGAVTATTAAVKSAWKLKLLLGVVTGSVAIGGATYYANRSAGTDIERARRGVRLPPVASTPTLAASTETPRGPAPPAPAFVPNSPARAKRRTAEAAPGQNVVPIGETQLLSQAVGALNRGDAGQALALTDQHRRLYPMGTYSEEFARIAIEALVRLGDLPKAEARARWFFRRFPKSAHRARLENLLNDTRSGAP